MTERLERASENERVLEQHHEAQKLGLGYSPIALAAQASRLCTKQFALPDPPGENLSRCRLKQELTSTGSKGSFVAGSSHPGSNDGLSINTLDDESDTSNDDSSNEKSSGNQSYSNEQ